MRNEEKQLVELVFVCGDILQQSFLWIGAQACGLFEQLRIAQGKSIAENAALTETTEVCSAIGKVVFLANGGNFI